MKLDDILRELDRRYLPRAVEAVRRARGRRPDPLAPLRRLDRRYARSGLLALLRDVPQLGAVLCLVLVVAGGLVVLSRTGAPAPAAAPDVGPDGDGSAGAALPGETGSGFVGAEPGAAVPAYLHGASARLDELAARSPDATVYALVDLSAYSSVPLAARILGGVSSVRVYFRPPVKGQRTEVDSASVSDIATDLPRVYAAEAKVLRAAAGEFGRLADSITGTSKDEVQFKESYRAEARLRKAEAAVLAGGHCGCMFAAVVRGTAKTLVALARTPGVRVVDPATSGAALEGLEFGPLPPEVTTVVPERQAGGAP